MEDFNLVVYFDNLNRNLLVHLVFCLVHFAGIVLKLGPRSLKQYFFHA